MPNPWNSRFFQRVQPLLGCMGNRLRTSRLRDWWLLAAIGAGLLLGAQGFWWGRYDCLNLDRMALRNVALKSRPYLHPKTFVKPPFYTYMNHFLARLPAEAISKKMFWLDGSGRKQAFLRIRLALARAWNLVLFAGCVAMVYGLVKESSGIPAARLSAALFATSAGFVPYQVFLTTDLAVIFMMLASFVCAVRIVRNPGMGISVAAGLLAGLAAATKYNGLIVAAALPVAHLLASTGGNPLLACLRRPSAWACGLAVPAGFLIGNPYCLLDWPAFLSDFLFNYRVTPVYSGPAVGTGYGNYFLAFQEIFGWPASLFLAAAILAAAVCVVRTRRAGEGWKILLLALVVAGIYTWGIGSFPRIETRFVLPAAPFVLVLASAGFAKFFQWGKTATVAAATALILYNLVCGWLVGGMFRNDPRSEALAFAEREIPPSAIIEVSGSVPRVQDLPNRKLQITSIPIGIARDEYFSKMFSGDKEMEAATARWSVHEKPDWFLPGARESRKTGWVLWCTIDMDENARPDYSRLREGRAGFDIVYDREGPKVPDWAYPKKTEFLRNRMTIWKKSASAHGGGDS